MNLSQMLAAPRDQAAEEVADHRPSSQAYIDAEKRGDRVMMAFCKSSAEDQVRQKEARDFEHRLTRLVQRLADEGIDHQTLETIIQRERARRQARRRGNEASDVPCKNWRDRVDDPVTLAALERTWRASVHEWARLRPDLVYLGDPRAPCQCRSCDPAGFRMRKAQRSHVDEFGPMSYPEAT